MSPLPWCSGSGVRDIIRAHLSPPPRGARPEKTEEMGGRPRDSLVRDRDNQLVLEMMIPSCTATPASAPSPWTVSMGEGTPRSLWPSWFVGDDNYLFSGGSRGPAQHL